MSTVSVNAITVGFDDESGGDPLVLEAAHMPNLKRPTEFKRALQQFLDSLEP